MIQMTKGKLNHRIMSCNKWITDPNTAELNSQRLIISLSFIYILFCFGTEIYGGTDTIFLTAWYEPFYFVVARNGKINCIKKGDTKLEDAFIITIT